MSVVMSSLPSFFFFFFNICISHSSEGVPFGVAVAVINLYDLKRNTLLLPQVSDMT